MVEFFILLICFIFTGLANSANSFFSNAINLDAIVVTGTLATLTLIFKSICEIGLFTYRSIRKDETAYLLVNFLVSFILGILIFALRDHIPNLFDINDTQKQLLSKILSIHVIFLPLNTINNSLLEMTRLKDKLKLNLLSLILFYGILILLDVIVFINYKDIMLLYFVHCIALIISIVFIFSMLKLKFVKLNKQVFINVYKYGLFTSIERIFSRVFLLLSDILASSLGTNNYAIHLVCKGVVLNLENITNAYETLLLINTYNYNTYNGKYICTKSIAKKYFFPVLGLGYVLSMIYLVISHGSLSINECFPYIFIYTLSIAGLYPYETYKTLCINYGKPKILLLGSACGSIVRLSLCYIFVATPYALYVFAISKFLDFYIRSLIFRIFIDKYKDNKNEVILIDNKEEILDA